MHDSPNPPMGTGDGDAFTRLFDDLRSQCDALIAQYPERQSALLPMIHLFQQREGYVSENAMRAAAEMLDLSPAVVQSTVSFYTLFFQKPVGKYMLQVCRGLMCELRGAEDIMAYFRKKLGIGHLETTDDGLFSYEEVECLAACDRATCMQVNLEFVYDLTPEMIDQMIDAIRAGTYKTKPLAQTAKPERTWKLKQDTQVGTGRQSPGTLNSSEPNNAGGIGDPSGIIMLDRFVLRDVSFTGRTQERTVRESRGVYDVIEEEEGKNGHAGH